MQPAVLFSRMHISSAQQLRGRSGRTGPLLQLQRLLSQCVALWAATVRTNREHTSLAVQHYRDCSASAEDCLVVRARRCRSTAQRRPASLFRTFCLFAFPFSPHLPVVISLDTEFGDTLSKDCEVQSPRRSNAIILHRVLTIWAHMRIVMPISFKSSLCSSCVAISRQHRRHGACDAAGCVAGRNRKIAARCTDGVRVASCFQNVKS